MLVAFFESIKYVGHFLPLAFLRIFMGYYYFNDAMTKYQGDFLIQPRLAATVSEWLPSSVAPDWYKQFLEMTVIPHWQVFAYGMVALEFTIGISFLLGYLVRPVALLGVFLSLNYVMASGPASVDLNKTFLAINLTMAWLGAGRCLGFDYFFFKRRRGIWW
jgi:thiosulfate dehydrogenase [quinone] large subunit